MDVAEVAVWSSHKDGDACNFFETWRKFRLLVDLMFSGPLKKKNEEEKCSYLLLWIEIRAIYNTYQR